MKAIKYLFLNLSSITHVLFKRKIIANVAASKNMVLHSQSATLCVYTVML